jgi:biotin carboxyl carrier protein
MKFDVQLAGAAGNSHRVVQLERVGGCWKVSLDGQPVDADVAEIGPHSLSVLLEGHSYTVEITQAADGVLKLQTDLQEFVAEVADPRAWRGRRHGGVEVQGQQKVAAPMPGKVIRVLVGVGDSVDAGQGLIVVEAMKMQNEIRSPKTGIVERLNAKEGQAVTAGEVLCVIS